MKKPRLHGTHPEVSRLLNDAQETAAETLGEVADNSANRARLADLVYRTILRQVALGEWADVGPREREDMTGLVVRCVPGNTLLGEARIQIKYDFSGTSMPGLLVDARARGRG